MKIITFPFVVKRGSVSIRIYHTPTHGSDSYTLSYYQDGQRKRPTFADFEAAKTEAEAVAIRLSRTDADILTLTSADRASYLRARQLLDPLHVSLETAASVYAEIRAILGDTPPRQAAEYFVQRHPKCIAPRLMTDVVNEMLTAKRKDGLSDGYLQHLKSDLKQFTGVFKCSIGVATGVEIDKWLRDRGGSPRTRNNLRMAVQTLFSYAKAQKYLAKDHDEMESVAVAKDRRAEIEVFGVDEMIEILANAPDRLVPFLTLGAFAGIRHAEIQRLDWKDIRFDDGIIEVRAAKAKTASRRTVPILDNLREWLKPCRQAKGPVCEIRNMSNEISDLVTGINASRKSLKTEQAFAWKHNAVRHSFISYRVAAIQNVAQVALEAGNSPQMIFQHYRELVKPKEAAAWFAITPGTVAEVKADIERAQEKKIVAFPMKAAA